MSFRWKDYRIDGPDRWKTMTLMPHEFIRRFLMHVLPKGMSLSVHPRMGRNEAAFAQAPTECGHKIRGIGSRSAVEKAD